MLKSWHPKAQQVDGRRLQPSLQRLGAKSNQQDFRVALMQAEPYMTHAQMEPWISICLAHRSHFGSRCEPLFLNPELGKPTLF